MEGSEVTRLSHLRFHTCIYVYWVTPVWCPYMDRAFATQILPGFWSWRQSLVFSWISAWATIALKSIPGGLCP